MEKTIHFFPIIDVHATWMAFNPIQGCPKSCRYCFLNGIGMTKTKPIILASEEVAVNLLLNSPYYTPTFPICFFSQTDAFSTPDNINYVKNVLQILHEKNIKNPRIFITKCEIPIDFIELCECYEKYGEEFIFYLSYSGLEKDIEIGVDKEKIKQNFINLYKHNQKIIHYWRPLLPQNSRPELINEMIEFVRQYAIASVIVGLKVQSNIIDNFIFWPELMDNREEALNAECVWFKDSYKMIWGKGDFDLFKGYPVYQCNSCALALALKKVDRNAFYNSEYCLNINKCPEEQRKRCKNFYINIDSTKIKQDIINYFKKVNYDMDNLEIKLKNKTVYINGIELKQSDITYLTQLTHLKIITTKKADDYYWNSSLSNNKPLII